MKRRLVAAAIVLAAAIGLAIVWLAPSERDIHPMDAASAKRALLQTLRRQHLDVEAVRVEPISTSNTWLADSWLFGIINAQQLRLGGPRYDAVYLVGPGVVSSRDQGLRSVNVTTDFASAFKCLLFRKPPATEAEALGIAKCYASLTTGTRLDRLQVLESAGAVPDSLAQLAKSDPALAATLEKEIVAPRVVVHQLGRSGFLINTVEFCSHSPDSWGDVDFWHMEIGKGFFEASRRPIHLASRALY